MIGVFSTSRFLCGALLFLCLACAKSEQKKGEPGESGGSDNMGASGGATGSGATGSGGIGDPNNPGTGSAPTAGGMTGMDPTSTGGRPPSMAVTPPDPEAEVSIEFRYRSDSAATSDQFKPRFELENLILRALLLKEVKVRYYFTNEVPTFTVTPGTSSIPNPVKGYYVTLKIEAEVVKMAAPTATADSYLEIRFLTDDYTFLRKNDVAVFEVNNYNATGFVQSNDYSFGNATRTFEPWDKVTVLHNDKVVWGVEPQ